MYFYGNISVMKGNKLTLDFCDSTDLLKLLRTFAAKENRTQKSIIVDALELYFSHQQESAFLIKAAEKTFNEWNNSEDDVYDTI